MATSVNCSFTDQNNVYNSLFCGTIKPVCCTSGLNNTCAETVCDGTNGPTFVSTTLFWLILAGVGALFLLVILVSYVICRYRHPRHGGGDANSEVFEETICETQIRTVTTRKRSSRDIEPHFNVRDESTKIIATRHKSRLPVRVLDQFAKSRPKQPIGSTTKFDNSTYHSPKVHGRSDSRKAILHTKTHLPDVNT